MASILLDLDGVLCDFVGRVCEIFDLNRAKIVASWPIGVSNISIAIGIPEPKMLEVINGMGDEFWIGIKLYDWADELFDFCQDLALTYILSRPTHHPTSLSGKVRWLYNWKGENFIRYNLSWYKELSSCRNSLLVDDLERNVEDFNKGDGKAILFPSYTNKRHAEFGNITIIKEEIAAWYNGCSK